MAFEHPQKLSMALRAAHRLVMASPHAGELPNVNRNTVAMHHAACFHLIIRDSGCCTVH